MIPSANLKSNRLSLESMFNLSQKKLVLCATANHLLAGFWHAGQLQSYQIFNNDDAGHDAFAIMLQKNAAIPLYFLADTVAEDYRIERIPHNLGMAKRELIARKLKQCYRGLEYCTAYFINREPDQRKDDLFLFVALNNVDFLQDWLARIQAARSPLVGIYLMAMLSQILLKRLKLKSPHILLCEKLSSGLRQTYLHNCYFRMSRLVPNIPTESDQLNDFYLAETEKMRLYLISQHFIKRETILSLVLVNINDANQQTSSYLNRQSGFTCTDVNVSQLAKKMHLPTDFMTKTPALLNMHLLVSGAVLANLAPKSLTKQYQLSQIKQLINLATIVLGLLGLIAVAWFVQQGLNYTSSLNQAAKETAIQLQRYGEVAKKLPEMPFSATNLKAVVALNSTIAAYQKSPKRLMLVVSAALEKLPEVKVDRLRWVFTSDLNIKDEDKLLTSPVVNVGIRQIADPKKIYEIGFITAEIANFNGDYHAAQLSVYKLLATFKKDNNVAEVSELQAPINLDSYSGLQGNMADVPATNKLAALFKLKLILKAPNMPELKQ